MWAMTVLGADADELVKAMERDEVVEMMVAEKPQAIAIAIWALARLGTERCALAEAISR